MRCANAETRARENVAACVHGGRVARMKRRRRGHARQESPSHLDLRADVLDAGGLAGWLVCCERLRSEPNPITGARAGHSVRARLPCQCSTAVCTVPDGAAETARLGRAAVRWHHCQRYSLYRAAPLRAGQILRLLQLLKLPHVLYCMGTLAGTPAARWMTRPHVDPGSYHHLINCK